MVSAREDIEEENEAVPEADKLKHLKKKQADDTVLNFAMNRVSSKRNQEHKTKKKNN